MTPREEIADIFGRIGDLCHRLAVLYQVSTLPPLDGGGHGPPSLASVRSPDPHDEPANVNAATPADCPLRNGGALYGWARDHDLVKRVSTLGTAWNYPGKITDYDRDQVAAVWQAIVAKAPPGTYPVLARKAVR
jgi:hypothetical protein